MTLKTAVRSSVIVYPLRVQIAEQTKFVSFEFQNIVVFLLIIYSIVSTPTIKNYSQITHDECVLRIVFIAYVSVFQSVWKPISTVPQPDVCEIIEKIILYHIRIIIVIIII